MKSFIRNIVFIIITMNIVALNIATYDTLPLDSTKKLNNYNNLSEVSFNPHGETVVIYTVKWCKPCLKLAKELEAYTSKDITLGHSIVFFNPAVMDIVTLKDQVQKNYHFSPYFYVEYPNELKKPSAYPFIAFHNKDGLLSDSIIGYQRNIVKKIIEYVSEKAK